MRSQQRLRYLRTSDGVQLAWGETGTGPVLVKAANWLSHLEYEWESPVWRHWMRFFSEHFRFIRHDERGCGMTDWNVGDLSFERWVEDLEALVNVVDPREPFALLGISQGSATCIAYAVKYPERFLALAHRPIGWLGALLTFLGVRAVLGGLTALTVKAFGRGADKQPELTEEELRTLVDVGATEGVVEREEREMIHGVFELEDTLVRSVMVPRPDMFCLDVETPVDEILPALRENLHSRVPVYEGTIDVIVGVLYTKDLLKYMRGLPGDFDLRAHLHPPYFVPETKRADTLLQEFQAKKLHMAIVVDEYGGTAGLVSLEDLLEEVVGEIADEYDEPERLIQRVDETTFRVAGKLPIDELNSAAGLAISNQNYETVGGWVLDLFGRVPRKAERVETPEVVVVVEKIERTRIVEVLLTLRKPATSQAAA